MHIPRFLYVPCKLNSYYYSLSFMERLCSLGKEELTIFDDPVQGLEAYQKLPEEPCLFIKSLKEKNNGKCQKQIYILEFNPLYNCYLCKTQYNDSKNTLPEQELVEINFNITCSFLLVYKMIDPADNITSADFSTFCLEVNFGKNYYRTSYVPNPDDPYDPVPFASGGFKYPFNFSFPNKIAFGNDVPDCQKYKICTCKNCMA